MSIFLELIPKEGPEILAELQQIKKHYPQINGLNFPDLLKYPVRSWDCAIQGHSLYQRVIPHIRAIDFDISKPLLAIDRIYEAGLREVLVLTGDRRPGLRPWRPRPAAGCRGRPHAPHGPRSACGPRVLRGAARGCGRGVARTGQLRLEAPGRSRADGWMTSEEVCGLTPKFSCVGI